MSDDKIYTDPSQPATLRYGARSIDCHTLQEAVLEWLRLSEEDRAQATISTSSGTVYKANEIDRLYIKPRVTALSTGSFTSNATATISSILFQPFGTSYVKITTPDGTISAHSSEARNSSGGLKHWRTLDAAPKPKKSEEQLKLVPVDNSFKVIFFIVLIVSISAIIAAAVAAQFWTTPTPNQQRVFEALEWAYKLGMGAIIGLISGQASRKP
jgi:hypothetical protein